MVAPPACQGQGLAPPASAPSADLQGHQQGRGVRPAPSVPAEVSEQSPRCWGISCCSKSLQRSYQDLNSWFFVKAEKQRFRENSISSELATLPKSKQ